MKNPEEKTVAQTNEEEFQKSMKDNKKDSKSNSGTVRESGYTDKQGNFIVAQNGVLTEAQQEQVKTGAWVKYDKYADGTYNFNQKEDSSKKK